MKLFPDLDTKKRFMKTGLPFMVGVAWAPIIWMLSIASLGPAFFSLTGSWPVTQTAIALIVLLATYILLKLFQRIGSRFYSKDE
ncbi:MAG: hypothetical protein WCL43_08125 [Chlorobium sp.]|jgi:hypothetical protein|nr:MAG: hypothetical protein FDX12_03225 [Chlorobium sp.]